MGYVAQYIQEAAEILNLLDQPAIERIADLLLELREKSGRLFLLGVGGGAGHASHAVCDFRKIAQIEAYAPSTMRGGCAQSFAVSSAGMEGTPRKSRTPVSSFPSSTHLRLLPTPNPFKR